MSTSIAALIATLITTGMTSAVSHEFTIVGGSAAAVMFAISTLVSRNVQLFPAFLFGSIALSILALVSSESNTAAFSSTVHVLSCYVAIVALAFSSSDVSRFSQQVIFANNLLLTAWVLYFAYGAEPLKAWQISNPSGSGNLMAAQINMTLPLILNRIHESRGLKKFLYLALICLNCVAVFMIMSRNGIGALLIVLTLYLLFNYKRLAVLTIGAILGVIVSLDSIIQMPFVYNVLVKLRIVGFKPVAPRSLIWQVAWEHIQTHQLLGIGPGEPKKVLAVIDIYHAHNNFVEVALETGIPSAVIFATLVILLLWLPARTVFGSRRCFLPTLSILAYLSYSWTATPLMFPGATLLLAVCVNEARVAIQRENALHLARRMPQRLPAIRTIARTA